jgi:predicted MPP superfamily phosphohydrolase
VLGWGLFEAQWVELRELEVRLPRLPGELDGLRILHLSDLHLGSVSMNGRVLGKTVAWARALDPDLVVVTGDLLADAHGEAQLLDALAFLASRYGTFAVLGNVDVSDTRDPFSPGAAVRDIGAHGTLLRDTSATIEVRGRTVQVAGLDPESRFVPPAALADPHADLRVLLAHFPDSVDRLQPGSFDLLLSGHTHGGQICLPLPGRKIRFSNVEATPYPEGVFDVAGTTLVVSRGLGTTFVPLRISSRPEATILTLRRGSG